LEQVEVVIWWADELEVCRGLSSEIGEIWSSVASQANSRWLWHSIDHHTGKVLASVFRRRKDIVFLTLKALLQPPIPLDRPCLVALKYLSAVVCNRRRLWHVRFKSAWWWPLDA
jgi:hypothetical protein